MSKNRVITAIEEILVTNKFKKIFTANGNTGTAMIDNYSSMFYQNEFGFLIYTVIDSGKDTKFKVDFFVNVNLKESNISEKDFQEKISKFCEVQILGNDNGNIEIQLNLEKVLKEKKCELKTLTEYLTSNYKFNCERTKPFILDYISKQT